MKSTAGPRLRPSRTNIQGRPTPAMGRFSGKREWETLYDGVDLADAIVDLNFVRSTARP